ncbi:MAG: hypothetical protein ACYDAG_06825 [Chloroflexota bacterium]
MPAIEEDVEGERPSDYIAIPVERGMPVPYSAARHEVEPEEREPEAPSDDRQPKVRRVNSGKLFWFIKSKSYVPIPEIRRKFEITPDEMSTIQDEGDRLYIGLPREIADVVANLKQQQKIGIECSVDYTTKVVIGVYPLKRM